MPRHSNASNAVLHVPHMYMCTARALPLPTPSDYFSFFLKTDKNDSVFDGERRREGVSFFVSATGNRNNDVMQCEKLMGY